VLYKPSLCVAYTTRLLQPKTGTLQFKIYKPEGVQLMGFADYLAVLATAWIALVGAMKHTLDIIDA